MVQPAASPAESPVENASSITMDSNLKIYLDKNFKAMSTEFTDMKKEMGHQHQAAITEVNKNRKAICENAKDLNDIKEDVDQGKKERSTLKQQMRRMESSIQDLRRRGSKK